MSERLAASPWHLVRSAVGGPQAILGKVVRARRTFAAVANPAEYERRMGALAAAGYLAERPNRAQLFFGGLDMVRFMIEPAAREYYEQQGISFAFHQLLRLLDDPMSLVDPTGIWSDQATIEGHLMQVVHLNPVFDVQLVCMFPDGLEHLESEVQAMVEGRHPRQQTIGAIVEEPDYHARLLDFIRRFRADPRAEPPVRAAPRMRQDPHYVAAEKTFATLPGYLEYCCKLPPDIGSLLRRHLRVRAFPLELTRSETRA